VEVFEFRESGLAKLVLNELVDNNTNNSSYSTNRTADMSAALRESIKCVDARGCVDSRGACGWREICCGRPLALRCKPHAVTLSHPPHPRPCARRELKAEAAATDSVTRIIELSKHDNAEVRLAAVSQLCPCRVKEDIDAFWERIFSMTKDDDTAVRARIMHIVCDGSPTHLEDKVADALEDFNRDKDADIRRRAHKVLAHYRKTGA